MEEWKHSGVARDSPTLRMAEPKHRKGPYGVSSGVSLREADVPISSVQRVKEICLHYVKKCSGKYVDNKAAARYVHQMAEEVIGQLAGVIAQIHRYEAEPEIYQALLDDWNANFPPSLGAAGTPRAIANTLARQAREIEKLKDALALEKETHNRDLGDVLRSMDAQLMAYRSGIASERRQVAVAHDIQILEHERKMEDSTMQNQAERENLVQSHHCEMQAFKRKFERMNSKMNNKVREVSQARKEDQVAAEVRLNDVIATKDREIQGLLAQIHQLNEQLVKESGILATKDDDTMTVVSLDLGITDSDASDDEEDEEEEDEASKDGSTGTRRWRSSAGKKTMKSRLRKSKTFKQSSSSAKNGAADAVGAGAKQAGGVGGADSEKTKKPKRTKKIQLTGVVAAGVKILKDEVKSLQQTKLKYEEIIRQYETKYTHLEAEYKAMKSRLRDMDHVNEEIRKALRLCLQQQNGPQCPEVIPVVDPAVLCHTPHFLGRADQFGLLENPQTRHQSAYSTAGVF